MPDLLATERPRAAGRAGRRASDSWGPGRPAIGTEGFDGFSGLHAQCLPWLHEREVAVLGSDGISDPMPFVGTPNWPFPVHQIGITGMGLHLIDNVALSQLSERCAAVGRWEFLFSMAPLRIAKGTGCPVNPWPCCERPRRASGPGTALRAGRRRSRPRGSGRALRSGSGHRRGAGHAAHRSMAGGHAGPRERSRPACTFSVSP